MKIHNNETPLNNPFSETKSAPQPPAEQKFDAILKQSVENVKKEIRAYVLKVIMS
ncbi:hypothetical protein D1AOALGA4SA_2005 [Olavius algarvensis Delta 1 endosymbiont]|nr:hypothetical protein D1AOALGA4SA_2005 [Olavius algarvensis Delta 1 endosymbiont]